MICQPLPVYPIAIPLPRKYFGNTFIDVCIKNALIRTKFCAKIPSSLRVIKNFPNWGKGRFCAPLSPEMKKEEEKYISRVNFFDYETISTWI